MSVAIAQLTSLIHELLQRLDCITTLGMDPKIGYCWYHTKFGALARRCMQLCLFRFKSLIPTPREIKTAGFALGDQRRNFHGEPSLRVKSQHCKPFPGGLQLRAFHYCGTAHRQTTYQTKSRAAGSQWNANHHIRRLASHLGPRPAPTISLSTHHW